jgi:putative addiction module component (TIGR02574 family)
MAETVEDLVRRGKALPTPDRERLVEALLESLNDAGSGELDASWDDEIARRLAAYRRGEVQAIDAAEVFARARLLAR